MKLKSERAPMDDVDRMKRVAFWYWEYMRRNLLYRKYCAVIRRYDDYFKSIGIYDDMQTKAFVDEMSEYVTTHEGKDALKFTPFRRRIEAEHGKKSGMMFFRYGFLSCGYEDKFGRVYKDCNIGMDAEQALDNLMAGKDVVFELKDVKDLSALIKLNCNWMLSVDDLKPDTLTFDIERANNVKVDPKGILTDPGRVGLEIHALNLINKGVNSLFEKQTVSEETLQSVYKLSLSGRHINSSDVMRLAVLWLWDKAHEVDGHPAQFDDVYPLLKQKVEASGLTEGAWEQIVTRRKRISEYYDATDFCIAKRTVIPLNQ